MHLTLNLENLWFIGQIIIKKQTQNQNNICIHKNQLVTKERFGNIKRFNKLTNIIAILVYEYDAEFYLSVLFGCTAYYEYAS